MLLLSVGTKDLAVSLCALDVGATGYLTEQVRIVVNTINDNYSDMM